MTDRERQLAIAKVLVTLLSEDLPTATWRISAYRPNIVGQIGTSQGTAAQRRADLRKWADFLGAELTVLRWERHTGGEVEAQAEVEGVPVRVWSHFLKKDLPKTAGGDSRG